MVRIFMNQTLVRSFRFLLTLGPSLPKGLSDHSTLEIHGDLFVFGGAGTDGIKSTIHKL